MKIRNLLILVLLTLCFQLYSESTDESSSLLSSPEESSLVFESPQTTQSSPNSFFVFIKMILVLAFVVGCIYAVMYFMRKSMKTNPNDDDPFLRKVSSVDLAVGKSVQVVTILNHAYLVGVSDNGVNLISEINDEELIQAMNLYADEKAHKSKPKTFQDILDIFMPGGPREKNVFEDSSDRLQEMLQKQRERLNRGE